MTERRSPALAVLACAAGGLLVLLASGRRWAHTTLPAGSGGGQRDLSVTGHAVSSSLPAIGIALLALAAAILASNRVVRRLVGLVIALVGVSTVLGGIAARGHVSKALKDSEVGVQGITVHAAANGWWIVVVAGGLLATLAGLLVLVRGERLAALGSKYDAPATGGPATAAATAPTAKAKDPATVAWEALDRGEDPTT